MGPPGDPPWPPSLCETTQAASAQAAREAALIGVGLPVPALQAWSEPTAARRGGGCGASCEASSRDARGRGSAVQVRARGRGERGPGACGCRGTRGQGVGQKGGGGEGEGSQGEDRGTPRDAAAYRQRGRPGNAAAAGYGAYRHRGQPPSPHREHVAAAASLPADGRAVCRRNQGSTGRPRPRSRPSPLPVRRLAVEARFAAAGRRRRVGHICGLARPRPTRRRIAPSLRGSLAYG